MTTSKIKQYKEFVRIFLLRVLYSLPIFTYVWLSMIFAGVTGMFNDLTEKSEREFKRLCDAAKIEY